MALDRKMLFTPGPVMTSDALKRALVHADQAHRRPAFEGVLQRVRHHLKLLLGADDSFSSAVITGSGTAANECALGSLIRPTEGVLLISNGPFGERLEEITGCHDLHVHVMRCGWGVLPDVTEVRRILLSHPHLRWVAMVWHETGTGMRNPVRAVGEVAHRLGRRMFVDCVSAFGGEDIHVLRDHIDACTSVANKAVGGLPGVAFVVVKPSVVPALGPDMPRRSVYLNLQNHLAWAEEHGQTPNTPAVNLVVALDHALKELMEERLDCRIERFRHSSEVVRRRARELGLTLLLPEEQFCHPITTLLLPPGIQVDAFIDVLDDRGYVVYPGKGPLHDRNAFQVCTMGTITAQDCRELMKVIEETLRGLQRVAA